MRKNKIYVTQPLMPSLDEYVQEIKTIFQTKQITNMGQLHAEFEMNLKKYLNCKNITLTTNGHLALENSLSALNLAKNGEVITTPFTFASTTHAIVRSGLKPVFCDINPNDFTIDTAKIENLITQKTVAILPVHVYGNICNIDEIDRISKKHNLKVIYDAAHAFGEKYKNVSIANYGDASIFSFHATKVFNSIEGGCITYNDDELTGILNNLKNFGITGLDKVQYVGGNAKMNEFQAAMGLCNLRKIDDEIEKRKKIYNKYASILSKIEGITIWKEQENVIHNYSYLPILFDKEVFGKSRDDVYKKLLDNNIFARKYFYPIVTEYDCYKSQYENIKLPIAKSISDNILTLPIYGQLDLNVVEEICDIILNRREID